MTARRGTFKSVDAAPLIAATDFLREHDARLVSEGWTRKDRARAHICRDGSLSLQFCWTQRVEGRTNSFTVHMRRHR
ncbi:MAG: hypothetical protein Q7V31_03640 [Parvibaculum sp.]|uniref:hypothetical protein n=1 Tax=Parvibaculum sp. TaxID=2024848 RepID=UPI0027241E84|nr:hypothetical protein [Parvibaculum sp.]MDO8837995.1 hypothetical protein [Parvibaculum sp.]